MVEEAMVQVEGKNAGDVWVADGYVPVLMSISKVLCVQVNHSMS